MKNFKNTSLRINNILLFLSFTFMTGSGLMLVYRLPPGSRGGRGLSMLGMDRHEWGDLHYYMGLTMLALMIIHLALNWAWMRKIAASGAIWKLWAGLALGTAIVVTFLFLPVNRGVDDEHVNEGRRVGKGLNRGDGHGLNRGMGRQQRGEEH